MGQKKWIGSIFIAICFVLLTIPLLGAFESIRYLLSSVIPISDFWFGYMGYFGTVVLASVAVWQTNRANMQADKANELSEKLLKIELKSRMGYFDPRGIGQYEGNCWEEVILYNVGDDVAMIYEIFFMIKDSRGDERFKEEIRDHTKYTVFVNKKVYIPFPLERKIEPTLDSRQVFMIVYIKNSRGYRYKQVVDMMWSKSRDEVFSKVRIMELEEELV